MKFAPLYPLLYQTLQPIFPNCLWSGCSSLPRLALTFDDGPHAEYTLQLLDVLDQYQVKASFFWLGICVHRSPQVVREVYNRGHWIGLHGYDHRSFPLLKSQELHQSLVRTQDAIAEACGLSPEAVRDVRPPNGLFTPRILNRLQQWNYRPVMWSVVPEDWVKPGVLRVVSRILKQVRNGSIIVLHDGIFGGEDVAETTRVLIPLLLQRNYELVTIDQLWQDQSRQVALTDPQA